MAGSVGRVSQLARARSMSNSIRLWLTPLSSRQTFSSRRSLSRRLGFIESEVQLQRDLPVGDLPVLEVTANLRNLEPAQVVKRLRGSRDGVPDGVIGANL